MKISGRVFALYVLDSGSTPNVIKTKAIDIYINQCVFAIYEYWLSLVQKNPPQLFH